MQKQKTKLLKKHTRSLLEKKGFTISKTSKSNAYEAIMESLTRNPLPQIELVNLEYLYCGCLSSKRFFAEVSKILRRPIILFRHDYIFVFDNGKISREIPQNKKVLPSLAEYENGIILFQDLENAFHIVTPSNR